MKQLNNSKGKKITILFDNMKQNVKNFANSSTTILVRCFSIQLRMRYINLRVNKGAMVEHIEICVRYYVINLAKRQNANTRIINSVVYLQYLRVPSF